MTLHRLPILQKLALRACVVLAVMALNYFLAFVVVGSPVLVIMFGANMTAQVLGLIWLDEKYLQRSAF